MVKTEFIVSGYLFGKIWMPATECFKDVQFSFQRDTNPQRPFVNVCDDLRDACLRITNDGDFQSCKLAQAMITIRKTRTTGTGLCVRERSFDLNQFPSVADMVDTEWAPTFTDD